MSPLVLCGLLWSATLVPLLAARVGEVPAAASSAEQVRAGLLEAQQRLRSVYVVYRVPYDRTYNPRLPPGAFWQQIVATKGPDHLYLDNAHGTDNRDDWRDDVNRSRHFLTAARYQVDWPAERLYEEKALLAEAPLPSIFTNLFFFQATGWWPPDHRWPPPRDADQSLPWMLHEVARSGGYTVRPLQEQRGGHWCHVLERRGADTLWIDVQRACALVARKVQDPRTHALAKELVLGDHREVAPGVWMPGWFEETRYDFQARTPEGRLREVGRARATVLSFRANEIQDDLFRYQPIPGAVWMDMRTGRYQQTHPGGLDFLRLQANRLRSTSPATSYRTSWSPGWLAGLPAMLVVAGWEGRLVWRRRRSPQSSLAPGAAQESRPTGPACLPE